MASYKEYKNKDGKKLYKVQAYLGIDPKTGKRKTTTLRGFKTKTQAKNAINQAKVDFINGKQKKPIYTTFSDVYMDWLKTYRLSVVDSTYSLTLGIFKNHILPYFGNKRINKVTMSDVQKIVDQWFKEYPTSYNKWLFNTKAVFQFAVNSKIIDDNPCNLVVKPNNHRQNKQRTNKRQKFLTIEELKKFFSCIDPDKELEKYTLFRVLAYSGIRRGELLALTWGDVDFKNNTIDINKTVSSDINDNLVINPPKTNAGFRNISMDKLTMEYLKKWRAEQHRIFSMRGFNTFNKSQLLFSSTTENKLRRLNSVSRLLNDVIKKYNLKKITPHVFRHTHASILASNGATIKQLQYRMGHSDVSTTLNIYAHLSENDKKNTADIFKKALN